MLWYSSELNSVVLSGENKSALSFQLLPQNNLMHHVFGLIYEDWQKKKHLLLVLYTYAAAHHCLSNLNLFSLFVGWVGGWIYWAWSNTLKHQHSWHLPLLGIVETALLIFFFYIKLLPHTDLMTGYSPAWQSLIFEKHINNRHLISHCFRAWTHPVSPLTVSNWWLIQLRCKFKRSVRLSRLLYCLFATNVLSLS